MHQRERGYRHQPAGEQVRSRTTDAPFTLAPTIIAPEPTLIRSTPSPTSVAGLRAGPDAECLPPRPVRPSRGLCPSHPRPRRAPVARRCAAQLKNSEDDYFFPLRPKKDERRRRPLPTPPPAINHLRRRPPVPGPRLHRATEVVRQQWCASIVVAHRRRRHKAVSVPANAVHGITGRDRGSKRVLRSAGQQVRPPGGNGSSSVSWRLICTESSLLELDHVAAIGTASDTGGSAADRTKVLLLRVPPIGTHHADSGRVLRVGNNVVAHRQRFR